MLPFPVPPTPDHQFLCEFIHIMKSAPLVEGDAQFMYAHSCEQLVFPAWRVETVVSHFAAVKGDGACSVGLC